MLTASLLAETSRDLVRWLRTWPDWLWATLGMLVLLAGGGWLHQRQVALAVHTDRLERAREVTRETDSLRTLLRAQTVRVARAETEAKAARAARDSAVQRTRAIEQRVSRSLTRFDVAIAALPVGQVTPAPVREVVGACTAVANDCAAMRLAMIDERARADSAFARGDSLQAAQADVVETATAAVHTATERAQGAEARAREAEKRPTWKKVVGITTTVGVVVWAVTKATITGGWQ